MNAKLLTSAPMFNAKPYQPPPVDSDEMSFALALFVAAARGKIAPPRRSAFSEEDSNTKDAPLLLGAKAVLQEGPARLPDEVPLVCAVSVLWHHYERDVRQQAMCSRLVAFHALIAQQQGALANSGSCKPEAFLIEAALSPAIVHAVATSSVGEDGLFNDAEFESLVESYANGDETRGVLAFYKPSPRHRAPHLSLTEDVQQLSLQLFAFQSCVAEDPGRGVPHFRTLAQLCGRVTDVSGAATLRAMLSRVWNISLPDFPWLKSTSPQGAELPTDFASVWTAPSAREAMRCEMAVLGYMIELLRRLLGDAVTVQLLRSLWPLAELGKGQRSLPEFSKVRIFAGIRTSARPQ